MIIVLIIGITLILYKLDQIKSIQNLIKKEELYLQSLNEEHQHILTAPLDKDEQNYCYLLNLTRDQYIAEQIDTINKQIADQKNLINSLLK